MNLSRREKRLIQALAGVVSLLILYFFVVEPIIRYKSKTESDLKLNKNKMNQLEYIFRDYQTSKRKRTEYMSRLNNNTGLLSLVESSAKSAGIKAATSERQTNIQNKYKKFHTNVKFESIDINSLLKFIHKIENSNRLLRISYLKIHLALKGRDTYDVLMKIESLAK
mgnify:CR=1 FL=1